MSRLKKPQICLAITPEDIDGKKLAITVNATSATVTLSMPTGEVYNNRRGTAPEDDCIAYLNDGIDTVDPVGTPTWTLEWDWSVTGDRTLGYFRLKRDPAATVELLWADAATTLDPTLFGFKAQTATSVTVGGVSYVYSDYQAGRLCLPERFCRLPEPLTKPWLEGTERPSDGFQRIHKYGDGGKAYTFRMDRVHGLYVHRERAGREDFIARRRGATLGDPNIGLSSILAPPPGVIGHHERSPLMWYPDRDNVDGGDEIEIVQTLEQRKDFEKVATESRMSPQLYKVEIKALAYKATP